MELKTYTELHTEFIEHEKKLYKELLAIDPSKDKDYNITIHLCTDKRRITNIDDDTIESVLEVINDTDNSDMKALLGYTRKIDGDVDAYCEDNYIEVSQINYSIQEVAYEPYDQKRFNEYLSNGIGFNSELKKYISNYFFSISHPQYPKKTSRRFYERSLDCKIIQLWKDNILDTKTAIKSTYTDCEI